MSATSEFERLRRQAGVIPYRRVGKVRMAYSPQTPAATVDAAAKAVKTFAVRLVDQWGEPGSDVMRDWQRHGLTFRDVCDDPCPPDVDPQTVAAAWLVERCGRWHFTLHLTADGKVRGEAHSGWDMEQIRTLTPAWFVTAFRMRTADVEKEFRARW
ncbi:hypothetical protein [Limnoglobus roseus]|uniref:Uncharacterized protein n=1 Tax=Limnoglobus roseus TaxID=2598579 RepID=A0A5C1AJW7_9BACT|nr:hypothetical protein [Limnoglobus roseus]QEL19501.1 hypothetical protein PX52LOC_06575 [Limnoglobus roseus]